MKLRTGVLLLLSSLLLGCGSGQMSRQDVEDQLKEQLKSEDPAVVKEALERFRFDLNIPKDMVPTVLDLIKNGRDRSVRIKAAYVIRHAKDPKVAQEVDQIAKQEADPEIRKALEQSYFSMQSPSVPGAG